MCVTCGCGGSATVVAPYPQAGQADHQDQPHPQHHHGDQHDHPHHQHDHPQHAQDHPHQHDHPQDHQAETAGRLVRIEQDILAGNDAMARINRERFAREQTLVVNLVSGPGAGKTSLLVRTITELAGRVPVAVVEGDQQTSRDADRIRATGAPAVQVNTGKGCHLDAAMVAAATDQLQHQTSRSGSGSGSGPGPGSSSGTGGILFVENVGNLVCPAAFDLGQTHTAVLLSVTEGEDKPLKYPDIFRAADLLLITKCDLLPYLDVDVALIEANAAAVNPRLSVIRTSVTTPDGLDAWLSWLTAQTDPTGTRGQRR